MAECNGLSRAQYLARRTAKEVPEPRPFCWQCRKPRAVCYCALIKPFHSEIEFVILVHPDEARRHIASARMAHLNLRNSHFVVGEDVSQHSLVAQLLGDPHRCCWLLYPGTAAVAMHEDGCQQLFWQTVGNQKQATVFVIDSTWRKARRMLHSYPPLLRLPRLAFEPPHPSRFQIRKQPAAHCWSTLEAIDYVIERTQAASAAERAVLMRCFRHMVSQQIEFASSTETS